MLTSLNICVFVLCPTGSGFQTEYYLHGQASWQLMTALGYNGKATFHVRPKALGPAITKDPWSV